MRLATIGTHVQTQHPDHEDVVGAGMIEVVHDQTLWISEARLALDAGLTRRLGLSLVVPVRAISTGIRYLDAAGAERQLVNPDIHHRDETVAGVGDPMVLGSVAVARGGWRVVARGGLTVPLGRTEEDPFALGDMGLAHQHIQLGTGTINPVVAVDASRSLGRWQVGGFALTQQVVYANGKGYQAGDRYAGGVVVRRQLGRRWSLRGGVDLQAETAERWGGVVHTDDGNRGRLDVIVGAAAAWAATERVGIDLALKLPVVTYAVGGQLDMPAIVELGASWSFGAAALRTAAGDDADHGHDDHDHGHGEEHAPGEEHAHGEDGAHADHGGDGGDGGAHAGDEAPAAVDTAGLDVADLGAPGEAVDLTPVPGKLTIFDFWAAWCKPCKVLEPGLIALARAHPDVVAIRRIDVVDWDSAATARHLTPGGFALPHVVVMDAQGRTVLRRSSAGDLDELLAEVRALVEAAAR